MTYKKVLVTGASGHIGANLTRALISLGYEVRALVHRNQQNSLNSLNLELVSGDVCDLASLLEACQGIDAIFHLAAIISITGDPHGLVHKVNVLGTKNIVEAALKTGVKRLVHFCSVHAFAQKPLDAPIDESRTRALDPDHYHYDRSKALGEIEVKKGIEKGLDAVIVHPSGVIGPYDFAPSRMGQVLLDLYHGKLLATVAGGFDWVDSRDVSLGAISALEKGKSGENYILSGSWLSVRELAKVSESVTGVKAPVFHTPMWLARIAAPFAVSYAKLVKAEPLFTKESLGALRANKTMSHAKAKQELGYKPRPIFETIRDSYLWFEKSKVIRLNGPTLSKSHKEFKENWVYA